MIKKIGHFHKILQLKLVDCNGFAHRCKCFAIHGLLIAGPGKKSTELLGLRQKHFSTSQTSPSLCLWILHGSLQSSKWV